MSIRVEFDTSEVKELARDFGRVPPRAVRRVDTVLSDGAGELKDLWKAGAVVSSGEHGPHYPNAITDEKLGLLSYVIGPESAMPQGGMTFEYGGPSVIHHPAASGKGGRLGQRVGQTAPHLDGNRAADVVFPTIARDVGEAVMSAFWH